MRQMPRVAGYAHNNMNPLLVLFPDKIITRAVFSKKTIMISDIEKVDVLETAGTENINIYIKNNSTIISFNLVKKENLKRVVHFFKGKGVIVSENAQALVDGK